MLQKFSKELLNLSPRNNNSGLNSIAEKEVAKRKAKPAFKGYSGYPCSLCCSLNDQVVHGIPNNKPLKDGDILSLDFGAYYDGFYGDAAVTVPVGRVY